MKWLYTVHPAAIDGEVEADTEDEASQATTQDALEKATDAIIAGMWDMWQTDDEPQTSESAHGLETDETVPDLLADDVQGVGGEDE